MIYSYIPENKIYLGYDIYFHYRRLSSLMEALKNGTYPIYIDYSAAMNLGYATKWFYPDIMLIPFAWLGNITNIHVAYKTMIFLFTFFTGIITYYSSNYILKNNYTSIVISLIYTFSLYRLMNLFYRSAIAEGFAMTFLPIIFLGLYQIIKGNYKKNWYILSIGFSLLIMTHLLSSVMTFILIIIFVIIYNKEIKKEPKRIYYLAIAGCVSFFISIIYLLPMIEQMLSSNFWYSNPNPSTWPQNNKLSILKIIWGMTNGLNLEVINQFPSLGIIIMGGIFLRLFINKKVLKGIDVLTIIGICLLIAVSNLFPWQIFPFTLLKFIQFPWRLYEFITYFFAISGGYYVYSLIKNNIKSKLLFISILTIIISFSILMNGRTFKEEENFKSLELKEIFTKVPSEDNYYHLGSLEYLPKKINSLKEIKYIANKINVNNNTTKINDFKREYNTTSFNLVLHSKSDSIEIPRCYYKGYVAYINDKEIPIEESKNGLIKIEVKESGKVKLIYSGTIIQKISPYISILSIIILCFYILYNRKKSESNA